MQSIIHLSRHIESEDYKIEKSHKGENLMWLGTFPIGRTFVFFIENKSHILQATG